MWGELPSRRSASARPGFSLRAAALALTLPAALGCGADATTAAPSDFDELQLKRDILADCQLPPADPLEIVAAAEPQDLLADPAAVAYAADGSVFVVESLVHRVVRFQPSLAQPGVFVQSQPGIELLYPSRLRLTPDGLWVRDTRALRRFDFNGETTERLRTFYAMHDFDVLPGGGFVISPRFLDWSPEKPLLVKLDSRGRRIIEFGERSQRRQWAGQDNAVFLSLAGETLTATFRHLPQLRTYHTASGDLLLEAAVEHPVFPRLAEAYRRRSDNAFKSQGNSGSFQLPQYLAGGRALEDSLWLLLHLPHLEIAEYSLDGRLKRRLRAPDLPFDVADYRGFDVRIEAGSPSFAVALIEAETFLPRVLEVRGRSAEREIREGS